MDELILLPFTEREKTHQYSFNTFTERNIEFTIMKNSIHNTPQSGNLYKFGLLNKEGYRCICDEMWWFFNGKAIIKGRLKALETFSALQQYCKMKGLGQPFAFKVVK